MKKKFYIAIASICVVLASIGVVVPLLPTTPFLLLAVYLFMKSSMSGVKMILGNRVLSPCIKSYFSKKGMSNKFYIRTLVLLWGALTLSAIFSTENTYVRLFLLTVGICVTIHLYFKKRNSNNSTK